MNKKLRAIYDVISSQENIGIISYNSRDFDDDTDACFVWDGDFGLWLMCIQPEILKTYGSLETVEESVGNAVAVKERWSDVVVKWFDPFSQDLRFEHFYGPMAFAFQHEVLKE